MATGMAIMGFGGGAMIGLPLADRLINYFQDADFGRCLGDLRRHGRDLFRLHDDRRLRYRVSPAGWRPEGWTPPSEKKTMISEHHVHLNDAHKTPQFWLIWWVLCLNVSAGIV